jgi:sugar phosphate isomerase/epimerase
MSLEDVIKKTKELGYDEIEFTEFKPLDGKNAAEYAALLRQCCKDAGLGIAAYVVGADFMYGSDGDPKAEAERIKGKVDIAVILGADKLRHDTTWGFKDRPGTFKEAAELIAPHIRQVAEYAESKGIRTMSENHGQFVQESSRMIYLLEKVGHPNYGALIDMGNFLCADEDPISAVSQLAPYAFHAHAKDFLWKDGRLPFPGESWFSTRGGHHLRGTVVGHGIVPVAQCIQILKNNHYKGSLSLEFEGPEEVLFAIKAGREFLSKNTGDN